MGGDDKSGIAAAIEAARVLSRYEGPRPTVKLLFTVKEEVGLLGARSLPDDLFDDALALVCDEDTKPGTVVVAGPYHYAFTATFTGIASHAGVAPEKGISAIYMAADAVKKMRIGRIDDYLVTNVGTISGGTADNTVPASCTVTGECRALDPEELEDVRVGMTVAMQQAASLRGGTVEVDWRLLYPGFRFDDGDGIVQLAKRAAADCGLPFSTELTLGATDANIFTLKGARCLLLGTGMTDFHTTYESLALRDLVDTARFIIAIIGASVRP